MIVLDAGVLIAYLDGSDAHHVAAAALLAKSTDDDLGVNILTLAEVLVVPTRDRRLDAVLLALRDIEVSELALPPDAAVGLARLRASTGLKMPDCCVLLTARAEGARLATFDDRLARAAGECGLETVSR